LKSNNLRFCGYPPPIGFFFFFFFFFLVLTPKEGRGRGGRGRGRGSGRETAAAEREAILRSVTFIDRFQVKSKVIDATLNFDQDLNFSELFSLVTYRTRPDLSCPAERARAATSISNSLNSTNLGRGRERRGIVVVVGSR
jgi:hypothetical protein